MIRVADGINVDLRGNFRPARNVRHADLETVQIQDFNLQYDMMRSTLNPWTFQVGVQLRIEDLDCSPSRSEMGSGDNWDSNGPR